MTKITRSKIEWMVRTNQWTSLLNIVLHSAQGFAEGFAEGFDRKEINKMENILNLKWRRGIKEVFPVHPMVQHWMFTEDTEAEAMLAHQMAVVAEKNGMTANDLQHIFPAVLRMLKNDSAWAK